MQDTIAFCEVPRANHLHSVLTAWAKVYGQGRNNESVNRGALHPFDNEVVMGSALPASSRTALELIPHEEAI